MNRQTGSLGVHAFTMIFQFERDFYSFSSATTNKRRLETSHEEWHLNFMFEQ